MELSKIPNLELLLKRLAVIANNDYGMLGKDDGKTSSVSVDHE